MTTSDDQHWERLRSAWRIRADTVYLNHGSFGPPPQPLREARLRLLAQLDEQPMDFFYRRLEPLLGEARHRLAELVGTRAENLALVENSTAGMNVVARSVRLNAGDEVLLTDHEYGAVRRIWERACRETGAVLRTAQLPFPPQSTDEVVDAAKACLSERTRLAVCSHITSPTALILPVDRIVAACRVRGVPVCIDGPHAVCQLPLAIDRLDCDYYTASCHKWLCAPFGSGFLYVHPRNHGEIEPPNLSWGRLRPNQPSVWSDEFSWQGTRDPTPVLTIPAAIDFMEHAGLDAFRRRSHELASYGSRLVNEVTGFPPVAEASTWYGSMVPARLPPCDAFSLKEQLWRGANIEIPVVPWGERCYLRISCHLYNTPRDVERLAEAIRTLL